MGFGGPSLEREPLGIVVMGYDPDDDVPTWFGASEMHRTAERILDFVQTDEIREVAVVFLNNARQATFLSAFPLHLFEFGYRYKIAKMATCKVRYDDPCINGWINRQLPMAALLVDAREHRELLGAILREECSSPYFLGMPTFTPSDVSTFANPKVKEHYRTLMALQVIHAWTAFETLAGDLWETAVNLCPDPLALMSSGQRDQGREKDKEGRTIPIKSLLDYGLDIKNCMGTILRTQTKCKFTSWDEITKSYQTTFPKDSAIASKELWSELDAYSVSQVRNLLVHKAGVVDQKFVDDCKRDPRMWRFEAGNPIQLTGNLIQQLLRGHFCFSAVLILLVDEWVVRHRQSAPSPN
jgi:hypothetical protein